MTDPLTDPLTDRPGRRTRRLLGAAAAVALAPALPAALAACVPGARPDAAPAAPKTVAGKVSWVVRNTAFELEWMRGAAIPDFARAVPDLEVELIVAPVALPNGADYDAKVTALVVGGASPDVWTHWGGRSFVDYLRNGWLQDLTPLVARDRLDLNAFLPNTVNWFKHRDRLYALPFLNTYGSFLYYNKQLLAQAGVRPPPADLSDRSWTWDAMVDTARKLTRPTGGPDAVFGLIAFPNGAQFLAQELAQLWGGDVFLPEHYRDGIAQRSQLDSPEAIAGHQARQDLIFRLNVIPTPEDTRALAVAGDPFVAGKIALNLQAGHLVRQYLTGIKDFDWGIAPIPPKARSIGPQFTDGWMLGKEAPNKEGGWALIKYLCGPEGQRGMVRTTGTAPALKDAEGEWFRLFGARMSPEDLKKVTATSLQNSIELSQHTFAKWPEILTHIQRVTAPIWQNQATAAEALRAGRPPLDQIVAQAYEEFRGIM